MRRALFAALLPAAIALPGMAAAADCPMTYLDFEYAVPHVDLEECPAGAAAGPAFCRLAAGQDALHLFVFAEEGEQCLLAVERYEEGDFRLELIR